MVKYFKAAIAFLGRVGIMALQFYADRTEEMLCETGKLCIKTEELLHKVKSSYRKKKDKSGKPIKGEI